MRTSLNNTRWLRVLLKTKQVCGNNKYLRSFLCIPTVTAAYFKEHLLCTYVNIRSLPATAPATDAERSGSHPKQKGSGWNLMTRKLKIGHSAQREKNWFRSACLQYGLRDGLHFKAVFFFFFINMQHVIRFLSDWRRERKRRVRELSLQKCL